MSVSRYKTRRFVFQSLYSQACLHGDFDREELLVELYYDDYVAHIDEPYFRDVFNGVVEKEQDILAIINEYAPKFQVETIPLINIIVMCIAIYEMIFLTCDTIPEKVSLNEAIELSKSFSDENSTAFINGVLHNVMQKKEFLQKEFFKTEHKKYTPIFS